MSTTKDSIEQEIIINAPQEQVFAALSNPEQLIKWFPDRIEGAVSVGEQPIFIFDEHGKSRVYIVESRPVDYFAFRWMPGSSEIVEDVTQVPTTLVEFFIEKCGEVVKVTLKESGFASLPAESKDEKFEMNSAGWTYMMDRLEKLFS